RPGHVPRPSADGVRRGRQEPPAVRGERREGPVGARAGARRGTGAGFRTSPGVAPGQGLPRGAQLPVVGGGGFPRRPLLCPPGNWPYPVAGSAGVPPALPRERKRTMTTTTSLDGSPEMARQDRCAPPAPVEEVARRPRSYAARLGFLALVLLGL